MQVRLYLVAALALLGSTSTAKAHTVVIEPEGSHFPYQRWVDEAELPTPEAVIKIVETSAAEGCPFSESFAAACAMQSDMTIYDAPVWLAHMGKQIFYHEMGHFVDYLTLPEWMRGRFMAVLGLPPPWRPGPEDPPTAPDEMFAEVFAQCAFKSWVPVHPRLNFDQGIVLGPFWGQDPIGGARDHNRLCRMLKRLPG